MQHFTIGRTAMALFALLLSLTLAACAADPAPGPAAPGQPTALTITRPTGSDNAFTLTWTKPAEAAPTGYRIESRTAATEAALNSAQFAAQGADITGGDTTTITITGLANGWWQFRVLALNGTTAGEPTEASSAVIASAATTAPNAPT